MLFVEAFCSAGVLSCETPDALDAMRVAGTVYSLCIGILWLC